MYVVRSTIHIPFLKWLKVNQIDSVLIMMYKYVCVGCQFEYIHVLYDAPNWNVKKDRVLRLLTSYSTLGSMFV